MLQLVVDTHEKKKKNQITDHQSADDGLQMETLI